MASVAQKIYWHLPYFVKCMLASWNARKLDRWRYGREYDELVKEIESRNAWSAEQFAEYQNRRFLEIVSLAARHASYYRRRFCEMGFDPKSITGIDDLSRLPILEKAYVRRDPQSLLNNSLNRGDLLTRHTSGTTGTPLELYRSVRTESAAFAYCNVRWQAMAGMQKRRDRYVSLGGQLVTPPDRQKPPFWVYNRRWNQLYMSSYHMSPANLGYYVDEIRRFGADCIEGYPSSMHVVAKHIVENGLEPVPLKACFTTAETLFDYQRETIQAAFGCRIYNQYGCGELCVFAAECEEGSMHLSPEVGIVEVVDENDQPVPVGQTGQLICTSLINHVQPFIRYRVGDVGALSSERCSCGSNMPVLARIEGRIDDVLITRDGRRIGRLDPVFKGAEGILEAQIVQDDLDKFRVRIVPGSDYTDADGETIVKNLGNRVGQADISIEIVDTIERTASGKFRAVVCNLPDKSMPGGR